MAGNPLVIGVGSPLRHDDGAGRAVAQAIREASPAAHVIEMEGEGAALIEAWTGADLVVIVDAARSGAAPGTVCRFEPSREPLPATLSSTSTHAFGLPAAVELARALGQLPRRLIVFGIEGVDFTAGEGLSPEVQTAVDTVVARVQAELEPGR